MKFVIGRALTILSWDNPVTAFFRKSRKLRHSLGRPSRSDFVQLELYFGKKINYDYIKDELEKLVAYNNLRDIKRKVEDIVFVEFFREDS